MAKVFRLRTNAQRNSPWRFSCSIVLHRATLDIVTSTNRPSGLHIFAAKLGKEQEQLLAVHDRALLLRALTLQSVAVGVSGRLLSVDYKDATLRANTSEPN